jgi:hypothetical protein
MDNQEIIAADQKENILKNTMSILLPLQQK